MEMQRKSSKAFLHLSLNEVKGWGMKKDINFADYIVDFFTFFFYQNESIDLFVVVVKENQVQTARTTDRRAHRKA